MFWKICPPPHTYPPPSLGEKNMKSRTWKEKNFEKRKYFGKIGS
jgi:hypothetical protein